MSIAPTIVKVLLAATQTGAAARVRPAMKRAGAAMVCAFFAAGILTVAIAAAITALWLCMLSYLSPAGAALAVAGILVAVAAVLAGVAAYLVKRKARREVESQPDIEALLTDAMEIYRKHKSTVLMAALLAGLVFSANRRD